MKLVRGLIVQIVFRNTEKKNASEAFPEPLINITPGYPVWVLAGLLPPPELLGVTLQRWRHDCCATHSNTRNSRVASVGVNSLA